MEFFWIIVSNIFTGAIVYLVLSLKIERNSSSIQEQKFRKEMNEIMTEFNSAAERNITILENKIMQVRNISNNSSPDKTVDYIVSDIHENKSMTQTSDKKIRSEESLKGTENNVSGEVADFFKNISTPAEQRSYDKFEEKNEFSENGIIEKEYRTGQNIDFKIEEEVIPGEIASDEDPVLLFENADDKYSAINDLFNKGYSIDEISKYSGLPAGEVRLVVSLNN